MSETEPAIRNKRCPLWPWVVTAVVLCLFAAGLSFWWRNQQAQQLVKFASKDIGHPYIDYQHPPWMDGFVRSDTFLPWYDHFYGCVVRTAPISDDLFYTLCRDADLNEVALDISHCSPETISELDNQPNLSSIELHGRQREIPLDWLKSMPNLNQVVLNEIPVPPDRWPDLLSLSHVNELDIADETIAVFDTSGSHGPDLALSLDRDHLTQTEAAGIVAISDLKRLTLKFRSATPEFWETLGRHRNLEVLTVEAGSFPSPLVLTETEVELLQAIPSLSQLRIPYGRDKKVVIPTEVRKTLNRKRPDIFLIQYLAD